MFRLPDGSEVAIQSAAALALVFTANQSATKTWLGGTVEFLTHTPEADRREILRGKDEKKGDVEAPLIAAFMSQGMTKDSAKVLRSQITTIAYGWYHGEAEKIAQAKGWLTALDIARARKSLDATTAKQIKTRNAVVLLRADLEDKGLSIEEAKEVAGQTFAETQAQKDAQAAYERLEKSANKIGFRLFPLQYTPDDVAGLAINAGMLDEVKQAINVAIVMRDQAATDLKIQQAEVAKGTKAAVTNERQQREPIAVPAMRETEKA